MGAVSLEGGKGGEGKGKKGEKGRGRRRKKWRSGGRFGEKKTDGPELGIHFFFHFMAKEN